MDKTLLELVSLVVTGVGIWGGLSKYSVPELTMTYLGENPFAYKRDVIERKVTRSFAWVALVGLLFQAASILLTDEIPSRIYSSVTYLCFFIVISFICYKGIKIVGDLAGSFARKVWLPKIVKMQRHLYIKISDILSSDYLRSEQVNQMKDAPDELTRAREVNRKWVEDTLSQIEKLLELPLIGCGQMGRLNRLKKWFGPIILAQIANDKIEE